MDSESTVRLPARQAAVLSFVVAALAGCGSQPGGTATEAARSAADGGVTIDELDDVAEDAEQTGDELDEERRGRRRNCICVEFLDCASPGFVKGTACGQTRQACRDTACRRMRAARVPAGCKRTGKVDFKFGGACE